MWGKENFYIPQLSLVKLAQRAEHQTGTESLGSIIAVIFLLIFVTDIANIVTLVP